MAITPIEAQETLLQLQIASFPTTKESARKSTVRKLERQTKEFIEPINGVTLSTKDMAERLARSMNG